MAQRLNLFWSISEYLMPNISQDSGHSRRSTARLLCNSFSTSTAKATVTLIFPQILLRTIRSYFKRLSRERTNLPEKWMKEKYVLKTGSILCIGTCPTSSLSLLRKWSSFISDMGNMLVLIWLTVWSKKLQSQPRNILSVSLEEQAKAKESQFML